MPLPLEQLEGKYEILEKLREGGMGAIYKVRHRLLDEIRVVKVIRPKVEADEELRRRFLHEARAAVKLKHPNIAQLHDYTVAEDGSAFMVMEFIEGIDLGELARREGALAVRLVLEIGTQSLRALDCLHRRDLVHRDISPDNLMLTQDDEGTPLVKLIDLGIAKSLKEGTSITKSGFFVGKIHYASPEHFGGADGKGQADARSDLYSLAVVLYELATGVHPVPGTDYASVLAGHLYHPPIPFGTSDPGGRVPDELRSAILKALEKDAQRRFQSAREFGEELQRIAAERNEPCVVPATLSLPLPHIAAPPRPGTTQDQLDHHFAPRPTPSSQAKPVPAEPPPPGTTLVEPRAEAPVSPPAPQGQPRTAVGPSQDFAERVRAALDTRLGPRRVQPMPEKEPPAREPVPRTAEEPLPWQDREVAIEPDWNRTRARSDVAPRPARRRWVLWLPALILLGGLVALVAVGRLPGPTRIASEPTGTKVPPPGEPLATTPAVTEPAAAPTAGPTLARAPAPEPSAAGSTEPPPEGDSASSAGAAAPPETASESASIPLPPRPPVVELSASPETIRRGESIVLRWRTTQADRVTLDPGSRRVEASGSLEAQPDRDTTYSIRARSEGGTTSRSVAVRVESPPPTLELAASAQSILAGETVVLSWESQDATTVVLEPGTGPVESAGSLEVAPESDTTYRIHAEGEGGAAEQSVRVEVRTSVASIEALVAQMTQPSLSFFQARSDQPPGAPRHVGQRFPRDGGPIGWQLDLEHPGALQRLAVEIDVTVYRAHTSLRERINAVMQGRHTVRDMTHRLKDVFDQSSVFATYRVRTFVEKGSPRSSFSDVPDVDRWFPGEYGVEVLVAGSAVAAGAFEVVD